MREADVIGPDDNPNIEMMKHFDESRECKKISNDGWPSTVNPDSRITKIKEGATHLAYNAEYARSPLFRRAVEVRKMSPYYES